MTSSASAVPFEELASLRARVQQFESQIVERDATIQQRDARIEQLHEQVRLLLARRFGASSEKLPDGQLGGFNEAEAEAGEESVVSMPRRNGTCRLAASHSSRRRWCGRALSSAPSRSHHHRPPSASHLAP